MSNFGTSRAMRLRPGQARVGSDTFVSLRRAYVEVRDGLPPDYGQFRVKEYAENYEIGREAALVLKLAG